MMLACLVIVVVNLLPSNAALPQFSWDTLPVFFHSSNCSGPYNKDALEIIAKFQMATIDPGMSSRVQDIDDEDEMVQTMKAVKKINPKIATYFYMNSWKDRPQMTRMHREMAEHPDYYLCDSGGTKVKNNQGLYVYDLSKLEVRQWWMNFCLNATKYADGDGCYCDSSQHENYTNFVPRVLESKQKAWAEGMLNLTREVQQALGDDKLLIGKVANQSYVKAVQMEAFYLSNDSINSLMVCAEIGQVIQAHVPINVSCSGDLTDYFAAFLIGAGEYAYFGCCPWFSVGNDTSALVWRPEYDKPLGDPKGPAVYSNGVWTRSFASGTKVTFDTAKNKGSVKWANIPLMQNHSSFSAL